MSRRVFRKLPSRYKKSIPFGVCRDQFLSTIIFTWPDSHLSTKMAADRGMRTEDLNISSSAILLLFQEGSDNADSCSSGDNPLHGSQSEDISTRIFGTELGPILPPKITDRYKHLGNIRSVLISNHITSICDSFSPHPRISRVTFGLLSAVTRINCNAFLNSSIAEIVIPDSVEELGDGSFSGCTSLRQITFSEPSSLKRIGDKAFCCCQALVEIAIPDSVEELGCNCFYSCQALKRIAFGRLSSLQRIGKGAFADCRALTKIAIPERVEELFDACFYRCKRLMRVTFSGFSSLRRIGFQAFCGHIAFCLIVEIRIPDGVEELCGECFYRCLRLSSVTFGESSRLKCIGYGAFAECRELRQIAIPDSCEELSKNCFRSCHKLSSVTFGRKSSLRRIGENAFGDCSSLTEISLPEGIEVLSTLCFYMCSRLSHISFGESSSLRLIEPDVFSGPYHKYPGPACQLTEITIPDGVEELGGGCFARCKRLLRVVFGESSSLRRIGPFCFSHSGLVDFSLPATVVDIGGGAFSACPLNGRVCFHTSSHFRVVDRLLLSKDGKVCITPIGDLREVVMPDCVEELHEYCFYGCKHLSKITFGSKTALKHIGMLSLVGTGIDMNSLKLPWRCRLHQFGRNFRSIFAGGDFERLETSFIPRSRRK